MKPYILLLLLAVLSTLQTDAYGQLIINYQVKQPSCITSIGHNFNQTSDGNIMVDVAHGVPPYTFTLSKSGSIIRTQNNGFFPGLIDGYYYVEVKDAAGQLAYFNTVLTSKYTWPFLSASSIAYPSSCTASDGSFTLTGMYGTAPYLYSIDGGNSYTTNNVFTNLVSGFYKVLTKDANGCMQYISVPQSPPVVSLISGSYGHTCNINLGADTHVFSSTSCYAEGITGAFAYYINLSNGTPSGNTLALQFSNDGINYHSPNSFSTINGVQDTVANLAPGTYKYYVKDSTNGNTAVCAFSVAKSCDIYVSYIQVDASCQQSDGALTITAAGGSLPYTYTIDGVHYQNSNTFTGLSAGAYSIGATDANGNSAFGVAQVYNKCPVITATSTKANCGTNNGSIQAKGYRGVTPYTFSVDGTNFQSSSLFANLAGGDHEVHIKDANGFEDSVKINVATGCLQAQISATDENCNHADGTITATGLSGTPPYSYSKDGINFQQSNYFFNLPHGNYTITIKDANLLTATAQQTINNTQPPPINLGNDTTLCMGQVLILSSNIANANYKWQDGSTKSSFTVSQAGKFWVVANINGCLASDTINVSYLNFGKIFTTTDTTACIGNTISLNAGHAGANFIWNDGSSNQIRTVNANGKYWVKVSSSGCSISDTITAHFVPGPIIIFPSDTSFCNTQQLILNAGNINATYLWNDGTVGSTLVVKKAGIFTVEATANGCTTYDTIKVTIKANPQIALGNDTTLCTGQVITLDATARNPIGTATYFWQDGTKSPLYAVTKQGNYMVTVAANGCDTTGKITVTYTAKPVINLGFDTTLCNTEQLVLDATYPKSSYLWQDGSSKPNFTVTQAGIYKVDVTNYCGTVSDSINVQYENCECVFYIPSAFSPNGDGKNDVFKPSYKCLLANYKLNIYSRFGKIIFTSSNAYNGWDGLINGLQQPAGVYVWEISYLDTFTNKAVKKNGTMVLVR